jgi:uncharacterized protein YhaN
MKKTGVNSKYSQKCLRAFDRYKERQTERWRIVWGQRKTEISCYYALNRSRKALLKKKLKDFFRVARIKTNNTFWQGTTRKESRSRSLQNEPRCRERNRRWRKSHHNKNLSAQCFERNTAECKNSKMRKHFVCWPEMCSPRVFSGYKKIGNE